MKKDGSFQLVNDFRFVVKHLCCRTIWTGGEPLPGNTRLLLPSSLQHNRKMSSYKRQFLHFSGQNVKSHIEHLT